jgi:hypothetical protein
MFVSTSTLTNHQFYFTGSFPAVYALDPSYTFTLNESSPFVLSLTEAGRDGACNEYSDEEEQSERKMNIIKAAKEILANQSRLLNCVPNPAENQVTFHYTLDQSTAAAKLVITDVLGNVVKKIDLDVQSKSVEIQVPEYSSGIYFYSLYGNETLIGTKKLIISK